MQNTEQLELHFIESDEEKDSRSLLDQLLRESNLYHSSKDYLALLDFINRMPNIAPFNAMLLQIQKPGLRFAATAHDWDRLFGRKPKQDARPLIILWPFGPVALVYDKMDTEGNELPKDVAAFYATGPIDEQRILAFKNQLSRKCIHWSDFDGGDNAAGSIQAKYGKRQLDNAQQEYFIHSYELRININHSSAVRFATLIHELGHMFLGHLGYDKKMKISDRSNLSLCQKELEAESVSYLVCTRSHIESRSKTYLAKFVKNETNINDLDIYQVMRVAGQVEALLGLGSHNRNKKIPSIDLSHTRIPVS
jgi:hypothetical protein